MTDDRDILERLKHPEQEAQRHQTDRNLFVRNILNSVFMLMAAVAMIGIVVTWTKGTPSTWCYMLGMLAVIIKMIEAMLRMPNLLKRPSRRATTRRRLSEAMAGTTVATEGTAETANGTAETTAEKAETAAAEATAETAEPIGDNEAARPATNETNSTSQQ
ncbi:MAG: hypothetical protein Q4E59_06430 [Bacteroidales bacterium]|nr:hypothetical protein [Bacteroidales bacterium]